MRLLLASTTIAAALLVAGCASPPQQLPSAQRAERAATRAAQGRAQLRTVAHDCLNGFSAPIFDPLRDKLAPRAAQSTPVMLAISTAPNEDERAALLLWAEVVMDCRDNVLAVAKQYYSSEVVTVIDLAEQRKIAKLLELYQGTISYGEYNRWLRHAAAADAQALREVKRAVRLDSESGEREIATITRRGQQELEAERRRYDTGLRREREALQRRGVPVSCSREDGFEVCHY